MLTRCKNYSHFICQPLAKVKQFGSWNQRPVSQTIVMAGAIWRVLLPHYNNLAFRVTSLWLTNQRRPRYNHRRSAEPRSADPSSSWCNEMWLELGSNRWSEMNSVQLNRDLIVVGATGPKWVYPSLDTPTETVNDWHLPDGIQRFENINNSQGSVATHLRWGGIFINNFNTCFLLNVWVKELRKSVNI